VKTAPLHEKVAHQLDRLLMFQKVRDIGLFAVDSNTQLNSTGHTGGYKGEEELNNIPDSLIHSQSFA